MSRNFEILRRLAQEQGAVATDSRIELSLLPDDKRTRTSGWAASRPSRPEILKLVHGLFLSSANAPHHVLFCGVGTDEGSGRVCASVAKALASEVSSRVCLVDAKVLGPSLQRSLDLGESAIPSSKSDEQRDSIARQIDRNLWFVSALHLNSADVSTGGAEQVCAGLQDIRKEFGYLLVDAPPLGTDVIASVLGQVTDGVVLVLEANATRRVTARSAKQTLDAANVRLLGIVLNNRTFPIPEKLYRRL